MRFHSFPAAIAALTLTMWMSVAHAQPKMTEDILTDETGMSLYWSDSDLASPGKSVCNDTCAINWQPLLAKEGATANGNYSLITRDDGTMQWAYNSKPLYRWTKDKKPGDRTGDGLRGGSWHLAKP